MRDYIADKVKNVFHALNRSMSRVYQIEGKALIIFHAVIVPMIAYGADIFEDRLIHIRIKSRLNSLRGMLARMEIGGYTHQSSI